MTALLERAPARAEARGDPWRRWLLGACAAVVVARLTFLGQPLRSDEGGYLMVARQWHAGGEFLYGDYHVDRPPLLMLLFRLAAATEWDGAIRVLSIPFAVGFVLAAARAAYLLAGPVAARWSAVVAAAFICTPAFAADQADGELFAAPLVMAAVALTVDAWQRAPGRARFWAATAAGVLAAAASLVKQNFVEGLVFAGVLVVAEALRRRRVTGRCRTVAAGVVVGAMLPNLAVAAWAVSAGVEPLAMWTDLAAFRQDAFAVIWDGSTRAPLVRAATLVAMAGLSGAVGIAWVWFADRRWLTSPVGWAVSASIAFGVAAVTAGGSYWLHYLLQLAPALALAAGLVAVRESGSGSRMRGWSTMAACTAVVGVLGAALVYAALPQVWFQERTGSWLGASSRPGDTAVVLYGQPVVLETAGLSSPYPYLWSLPMRTLDPDQDRLRAVLAGDDAPTWVATPTPLDSWHIDRGDRLRTLLERRYDVAATVCGQPVWLRADLERDLAVPPLC